MKTSDFQLGSFCNLDGSSRRPMLLPSSHLTTHGVVVGMTGSGKTGLLTVMVEEALRCDIPVLIIDVKGDLPNLLLHFPGFESKPLEPWLEPSLSDGRSIEQIAIDLAKERRELLASWNIGEPEMKAYCEKSAVRVITPGSSAGELLHVLSSLERPSKTWKKDPETARNNLCAAVSLVLRLLRRNPDPVNSADHVLLSVLAERHLSKGEAADLETLAQEVAEPPFEKVGALKIDDFMPESDRKDLISAINTLLASPTFSCWRQGASLDIAEWFRPKGGKTPAVIVSVAHLDDDERNMVLGMVLEELHAWVKTLPGSSRLRGLVVFDEVYGYLPPHPANPPTKRPLVALMKRARAFGIGMIVATQNPMDLDCRALGNAGLWCIGHLQTEADCERVLDGLASSGQGESTKELGQVVRHLGSRWFLVRDVNGEGTGLLQARYAMTLMRGPMTKNEIRQAREGKIGLDGRKEATAESMAEVKVEE
jgi:hypothetical protein